MKEYDLIIVGSGTAGRKAVPIAKEAGWKVAFDTFKSSQAHQ